MRRKCKFYISMGLILAMVMCSSALSYATENVGANIQYDIAVDTLNPNDYIEANEQLVQLGESARRMRSDKLLDVFHYYQSGQTWSNDIMQTDGLTIGAAGCCLTSFTMIQDYYGGAFNPSGVNYILGDAACPFDYSAAATAFDYNIPNYKRDNITDDYAINFIAGGLFSGCPVLVGMTNDTTGSTHFVTAYGYVGGEVLIHDPSSGRDYTTLSQYLANYYVHRLYIFTN